MAFGRPRETGAGTRQWSALPGFGAPRAEYANADEFLTELGQDAILEAYRAGLGVTISKTSDGGAISLKVFAHDDRFQAYAGNADEAELMWEALGAYARSKMPTPAQAPAQQPVEPVQPKNRPRNRPAAKLPATRTGK